MRHSIMGGVIAAILLTATPVMVSAQAAAPATQAAPDAATAHKAELVRRYFVAAHMDDMIKSLTQSMMPMMIEQQRKAHPEQSEAQATHMANAVSGAMADFMPKYMDRVVDLYAVAFSEDELTQMVAFYESPVGQSIVAKMPGLMPKTMQLMSEMMPELQADMAKRMCDTADCAAAKPKPAT